MRDSRRSGPTRLVVTLLVLVALTLSVADYQGGRLGPLSAVRRGVDAVVGPVVSVVGRGGGAVGRVFSGSSDSSLRRENDALKGQVASLAGAACEQQQLTQLLALDDYLTLTAVPARVVSRGAGFGFEDVVTIDAGSLDGLRPGMPVVAGQGLVGRTVSVARSTSSVLLLTDRDFGVGGTVAAVSAFGTVSGQGSGDLSMSLEATQASIPRGSVVVTAGSGTYPAGLPVGRVTTVQQGNDGATRLAAVQPAVDPARLDLVGVITQPQRTAPRTAIPPGARPAACG